MERCWMRRAASRRENARAVRMAQQAGVQIVLCTGRNVREVRRFSEQLEAAPDWLVTANGAAVQHPDDREPAFFDGPEHRNGGHHPERVHCH